MFRSLCLALTGLVLTAMPAHSQTSPDAASPAPGPVGGNAMLDRFNNHYAGVALTRDFSGAILVRQAGVEQAFASFGYADWESGAMLSRETRFASDRLAHGFIAGMLLGLANRDRIDLDARVETYIPELANFGIVTVRDVLEHRVILPDTLPALPDTRSASVTAWLAGLQSPALNAGEGRATATHYALMAILCERTGGGRAETLITARIFAPLDLTDTRMDRSRVPDGLAAHYGPGSLPLDLTPRPATTPRLGGSVTATLTDMARWGDAVISRRIDLFSESGQLRGDFDLERIGNHYVYIAAERRAGHQTGLAMVPAQNMVISWAVNIASYPAHGLAREIAALALGEAVTPLPVRSPTALYDTDLHGPLLGSWFDPEGQMIDIAPAPDGLRLFIPDTDEEAYLTPLSDGQALWRERFTRFTRSDAAGEDGVVSSILTLTGADGSAVIYGPPAPVAAPDIAEAD